MLNNITKQEIFQTFLEFRNLWMKKKLSDIEKKHTTLLQYNGLEFIHSNRGCLVSELAEKLGLSVSSSTQFVERLVQNHFVKRTDDEYDRRLVHIHMTEEGEIELKKIEKEIDEKMNILFKNIPEQELKIYLKVQKEILHNLFNHQQKCFQK